MKRILIIEDQAENRDLIRMTLELGDFEVHEEVNGEAGLKRAREVAPDLVLLDVMMPGALDGWAVCRQIRADARLKRTRVVMLTARDQANDRTTGLQAGADDYLSKPFSPRQLLQVVQKLA
jgi:DNA-binding response OmpR family regulator